MSQELLVAVDDGVMTLTINRPEARNAMSRAVALAIAEALDRLDDDDSIRVAILTGAGGIFCAGMDLKGWLRGELPVIEGRGFGGLVERPPAKPLIAAVEGHAIAGGCELALACDLVVAGESARFGLPEVKRGLAAGAGGLMALPRQIPPRIAMELALTGDPVQAPRAYELGLINRVVETGSALTAAQELARTIAANGPLAVLATKRVMLESAAWSRAEMFDRQREILQPIYASDDAKEGARAFAEKRSPKWSGR